MTAELAGGGGCGVSAPSQEWLWAQASREGTGKAYSSAG